MDSPTRARTAVAEPIMERVSKRAEEVAQKLRMDKNVDAWQPRDYGELAKYSYFRHPGLAALAAKNRRNQKEQAVVNLDGIVKRWCFHQITRAFVKWIEFARKMREADEAVRQREQIFEARFPDAPSSKAKVLLRNMLSIVDREMMQRLLHHWEIIKFGFSTYKWKLTAQQLDHLLRSFPRSESSGFRDTQLVRILSKVGIKYANTHEGDITWEYFTRQLQIPEIYALRGDEEEGGMAGIAGKLAMNKVKMRKLTKAHAAVLQGLSEEAYAKLMALPESYRAEIAEQILKSGISAEQWQQIAMEQTLKRFHNDAANKFQSAMRGWYVRKKLAEKRLEERCVHYFALYWMNQKFAVFAAWRQVAQEQLTLRRRCWSKLRAWHQHIVHVQIRAEIFRCCFWPFYVWHREVNAKINARLKARFLVRVYKEVVRISHIRAWRRITEHKIAVREKVGRNVFKLQRKMKGRVWAAWLVKLRQSQRLSMMMESHRRTFRQLVACTFVALRYYARGKVISRDMGMRYRSLLPNGFTVSWEEEMKYLKKKSTQVVRFWHGETEDDLLNESPRKQLMSNCREVASKELPSFPSPIQLRIIMPLKGHRAITQAEAEKTTMWVCKDLQESFQRKTILLAKMHWHQSRVMFPAAIKQWNNACKFFRKERRVRYLGYFARMRRMMRTYKAGVAESKKERAFLAAEKAMTPEQRMARQKEARRLAAIKFDEEWDENEDWRQEGMNEKRDMVVMLRKRRRERYMHRRALKEKIAKDRSERANRDQTIDTVMLSVEQENAKHLERIRVFGSSLLENRAETLFNAVRKVFDEVRATQDKFWLRKTFGRLVLVVKQRHAMSRYKRDRLRNFLRICSRLRLLYRIMPEYHAIRTKWRVWCSWLKYIEAKYSVESPGLNEEVTRRRQLGLTFHRYLTKLQSAQVLQGGSASVLEDHVLNAAMFTQQACISRWAEYAQVKICVRRLVVLRKELIRINFKQRIFDALKTGLKSEYSYQHRQFRKPCFEKRRLLADVDKWKTRFLAHMHQSASNKYRRMVLQRRYEMHNDVMNVMPTLKKLLANQRQDVRRRVRHEQRLLCNAFRERNQNQWGDFRVNATKPISSDNQKRLSKSNEAVGSAAIMLMEDPIESFVEPSLAQESSICSVVVHHDATCIYGVRRVFKTPGKGRETGELHGDAKGTEEMFDIDSKFDSLAAIEGYATDDQVTRLRFHTAEGHESSWYGVPPPARPGTYFMLKANDSKGDDDGSARVIGFCGLKSETRLVSLGALVRRKLAPNVFGRCWKNKTIGQTEKQQQLSAENQFAIVLRMRACFIMDLLKRCQDVAKNLRATKTNAPEGLDTVRCAFGVSNWMFEALSHGLVKVPTKEMEARANKLLLKGNSLQHRGDENVKNAEAMLEMIDGYSATSGRLQLDPSLLGSQKVMELKSKMAQANLLKREGLLLRAKGQELVLKSQKLLPSQPPTKPALREYFEGLVNLTQTMASFDKEEMMELL